MIAAALRVDIERHAEAMRRTNPLLVRASDGTLEGEHVARYLAGIHQLVQVTPVHLARARQRAAELGLRELADHFAVKVGEEVGHHLWAENDLENISTMRRTALAPGVSPAMAALIGYLAALLERDPTSYLAYTLVAEYVTVLLGPAWLDELESCCGIPRSAMSVVGNHAELDAAHSQDAFDHVDAFVRDPRVLPALREVVRTSLGLFEAFCAEAVMLGDSACAEAHVHAPAA